MFQSDKTSHEFAGLQSWKSIALQLLHAAKQDSISFSQLQSVCAREPFLGRRKQQLVLARTLKGKFKVGGFKGRANFDAKRAVLVRRGVFNDADAIQLENWKRKGNHDAISCVQMRGGFMLLRWFSGCLKVKAASLQSGHCRGWWNQNTMKK